MRGKSWRTSGDEPFGGLCRNHFSAPPVVKLGKKGNTVFLSGEPALPPASGGSILASVCVLNATIRARDNPTKNTCAINTD